MTTRQKIIYFIYAVVACVLLALFDFYIFDYVIDIFSTDWLIHVVVLTILILFVNPFVTLHLLSKIPFKVKGLKVDKGLKEALKKESL